jgi:hypothetical protein
VLLQREYPRQLASPHIVTALGVPFAIGSKPGLAA